MRIIFAFVLFVITSLIPLTSAASEWKLIGADDSGNNWAVDTSSIVSDGLTVRAWARIDFKEQRPYPPTGELIQHVYGLDVVNCGNHQIGIKASRLLRSNGSVIAAHEDKDADIQWQTVAPDTVTEKTMMYICSTAISNSGGFESDKSKTQDTEFRKTKNDFSGLLVVTSDTDWAKKWSTSPDTIVNFKVTKTIKLGDELAVLTLFVNPKPDKLNNLNVQCSLKLTRPDNIVSVYQQGIACAKGELQGNANYIRLSPGIMKFVAEKSDPVGIYVIDVEINDVNRNTALQLRTQFELLANND